MWDLWWTKWHRGRFSPSTSVSTASSHSTDCFTVIIRRSYDRPNSGRHTKWTQSPPPTPRTNNNNTHVKVWTATECTVIFPEDTAYVVLFREIKAKGKVVPVFT
jgi:hypothetical protein